MFHESYYEHSCILQSDKDVLYTDIKGKNCWASFQRWWHNLFLLAYNDVRCRIYYTSSQAMRLERIRQFRQYKNRIHPLSKFRCYGLWHIYIYAIFTNFTKRKDLHLFNRLQKKEELLNFVANAWTWLVLVVSLVNRVTFHHNSSILYGGSPLFFYFLGVVLDLIMIVDLYVCFKTGYIDHEARRVILSEKKGYIHFASTKLFLYTAGALPLHIFLMIRYGLNVSCNRCKANRFVCTLKFLSIFALYRAFDASRQLLKEQDSFKLTYFLKFFRIAILAVTTMFQFLNFGDTVNTMIMIDSQKIDNASYLSFMLNFVYIHDPPKEVYLCFEFSIICKSLLMYGYGFREKIYYLDIMFGMIGYMLTMVFYMWSLMECYAVVDRLKSAEDQITMLQNRTMNMLRCRQLPDMVSSKVKRYYDFNMAQMLVVERMNDLYQFLPSSLIREIKLSCYFHLIKRIPYFENWPLDIIEGLVMRLREDIFLEQDIVADKWTSGEGLAILEVGVLAVYNSRGEELGHLIDGDVFGELSLVTDKEVRTSTVVAVTKCKILILCKMPFRKYMRQYPELFYEIRNQLRQKFGGSQSLPDLSDKSESKEAPEKPGDVL